MKKSTPTKFLTTILLIALAGTVIYSSTSIPRSVAQSNNQSNNNNNNSTSQTQTKKSTSAPASGTQSNNSSSSPRQSQTKKSTSILEAILSLLKSPENRLITRGNELCPMSPGNIGEQVIWSDRPLFVWAGTTTESQISVFSPTTNFNYEQDDQLIWTQTVAADSESVAYDGAALEPGLTYDWHLLNANKKYRLTFILMEQREREAIARELAALEEELQVTDASSEDIAIAKADYFVQRQLWSDALQELYAVKNPSPLLVNKTQAIANYLCQSSKKTEEISNR